MSRKSPSILSGAGSGLIADSHPPAVGANGSAPEDQGTPHHNNAVVTDLSNLSIVNNAKRGTKSAVEPVACAKGNAAVVTGVRSLPPQVNADVANVGNSLARGTKPKLKSGAGASVTVAKKSVQPLNTDKQTVLNARENLPIRVRVTRFSHCELCNERDTSRMVQCDGCDLWYHFSCVEVSSGIANCSWSCPSCGPCIIPDVIDEEPPNPTGNFPVDPPPHRASSLKSMGKADSNRSNQRKLSRRLQMLEEQKRLEQKYLEEKYRILDEEDGDEETIEDELGSMEMSKVREWLQNTNQCGDYDSGLVEEEGNEPVQPKNYEAMYSRLAGRRSTLHDFNPHQRSTPRERFSEINQVRTSGLQRTSMSAAATGSMLHRPSVAEITFGRPGLNTVPERRRMTGAAVQFRNPLDNSSFHQALPTAGVQVPDAGVRQAAPIPACQQMELNSYQPCRSYQPAGNQLRSEVEPRYSEENVCILNRSQLAARQAVSKELPDFYGDPEDWPLFISMYNSSTQMCGFSHEENMLRLRKCLRGKALEAVRCRLLHPSNVASVISTLRMLYGRPEAIVQASIRKIRSLPLPQVEKLETVVNFALTVENLVATVEACGVEDFVYNASIIIELVDRLHPGLELD
ncbi:uncharacterized protein LOC134215740 [Armigeres subalbatus]|uniref:uncharacterized protein LOC134215740 n=1 Tax=Armigeres subalbatus TaxID=124917 RepID=UPI002ECFBC94